MPEQTKAIKTMPEKKNGRKPLPAVLPKPANGFTGMAELYDRISSVEGGGHIDAQAGQLADIRLLISQRHAMASQIGQVQGNMHLQRAIHIATQIKRSHVDVQSKKENGSLTSEARATIQRKSLSKAALEKKYGITIETGDKNWSVSDINDLGWALNKLSKPEAAAIKGYRFLRWKDRASRRKADPTYNRSGEEEAGLHEADLAKNVFKISLYDAAFDSSTTMELVVKGRTVGKPQPISRIGMLHEIAHAMEIADIRKAWSAYKSLETTYNLLIDQYNKASPAKQARLKPRVDRMKNRLDILDKKVTAAKDRAIIEFQRLAKGMPPVTEYAKTNIKEAFAETFALYKLNPKGIALMKPRLAAWFKKHGYLGK
jgi:hypothetical protein